MAVPLRVVAVHRPHALQQGFLRQPSPPAATLGEGLPVGTHQLTHLGRPGLPHISLAHVSTMYIPGLHRQKPSFVQTPRRLQAIVAPVGAARARILRSPDHRVKRFEPADCGLLTTANVGHPAERRDHRLALDRSMEMEDEPTPEAPFYSPDQQKTIRQGLRILVRIAVRAHVQLPSASRSQPCQGLGMREEGPA